MTNVPLLFLAALLLVGGCHSRGRSNATEERQQGPIPPDEIPPAPVLSPQEALADFKVEQGFTVELVAAEPKVVDPVALAFDGNGALWVVEMPGYMTSVVGDAKKPLGRIRVLRDTDANGTYETVTTFLDSLALPRAVRPLLDGVLVAEPPALYFVERTGDGYEAGTITVVDSTYAVGGNPEHKPNGLLWARDNWIYSAKSDVRYRRIDGRWQKDSTEFRGQWGITQDDYGRLFYNHNSATLLGDDFLPNVWPGNPHHERAGDTPYSEHKASNRVFPRRMTPGINRGYREGMLDEEGKLVNVTAASGPVIYRGDQFPSTYYGNAFVPAPTAHVVKRVVLSDSSGEVTGTLPYTGREFLSSTDERFRPVNAYTAPDGSLYIVDMYQGILQHKTYLTDYLKRQIKMRGLGEPEGLGRIYRVRYEGKPLGPQPRMLQASSARLVEYLTHPNGWWRDTAQRLLVERGDRSVIPALRRLATDARPDASGQIHALWTLEGLDAITLSVLRRAAQAEHPKVRSAVVHLVRLEMAGTPRAGEALDLLASLLERSGPEVNLRVTLALHGFRQAAPERVRTLLASVATTYGDRPIFRDAILSGLEDRERTFLTYLRENDAAAPQALTDALLVARTNAEVQPVTRADVLTPTQIAALSEGQALYESVCASCHGEDGQGIEDLGPPLVRSKWVLQEPETLTRLVLDGLHGPVEVDGTTYVPTAVMPGHRSTPKLTDEALARLLTFVRNGWESQRASAVSTATVRRVRTATKDHAKTTYTAEELKRIEAQGSAWTPLKGWRHPEGSPSFELGDDVIIGTPASKATDFLITEKEYDGFVLELDFKVDSLLSAGVLIRGRRENGSMHGYRIAINPAAHPWTGGVYETGGRGWLFPLAGHRAAQHAFQPDAWNHLRIEARGPHLRTWLNGVLAADLIDDASASGFIALTVSGSDGQVKWRNLRIKVLSDINKNTAGLGKREWEKGEFFLFPTLPYGL